MFKTTLKIFQSFSISIINYNLIISRKYIMNNDVPYNVKHYAQNKICFKKINKNKLYYFLRPKFKL